MRYSDSIATTSETFRMVLQKLTELHLPFSPIHYAVVYEYIAGINPPLKEGLETLLASHSLSPEEMEKLFINYIVPEFLVEYNQSQMGVTKEIQDLLGRLSESTSTTTRHAEKFQEGLENYRAILEKGSSIDAQTLLRMVKGALKGVLSMSQSTGLLDERLKESQSEISRLQNELRTALVAATVDPLTDLLNRRGFEAEVEECMETHRNTGQPCTILMIDIDHFKKVNDTHGHLVGDRVIQAVAKAIKLTVRGEDIPARIGGEEFAVVLPHTNPHQGFIVAEHIRARIERIEITSAKTHQKMTSITVSIGLDSLKNGLDWNATLNNADKALYQSKNDGRNRTTAYFEN